MAMAIKFRYQKSIRGGCILIHPCLCTMVSSANRTFFPAPGFRAANRGRSTPVRLLPPNTSANRFNQKLNSGARDLNYEDERRYPTPPPRLPPVGQAGNH